MKKLLADYKAAYEAVENNSLYTVDDAEALNAAEAKLAAALGLRSAHHENVVQLAEARLKDVPRLLRIYKEAFAAAMAAREAKSPDMALNSHNLIIALRDLEIALGLDPMDILSYDSLVKLAESNIEPDEVYFDAPVWVWILCIAAALCVIGGILWATSWVWSVLL